jgi:hypothetical protein
MNNNCFVRPAMEESLDQKATDLVVVVLDWEQTLENIS